MTIPLCIMVSCLLNVSPIFFFFCWLVAVPLLKDSGSFKVFDQYMCPCVLFFFFFFCFIPLQRFRALSCLQAVTNWFSVQLFRQKHLSPVSRALSPRNELLRFFEFCFHNRQIIFNCTCTIQYKLLKQIMHQKGHTAMWYCQNYNWSYPGGCAVLM